MLIESDGTTTTTNKQGRRVLVIDDVITAGTAIRETMAILQPAGANVVGLVLALDRQERMSDASELSAVQVPSCATVDHAVRDLRTMAMSL